MSIMLNEYASLMDVLVKSPRDAFLDQDTVDENWSSHNYLDCPNFKDALEEHELFVQHLKNAGAHVTFTPAHDETSIDSLYMRDSSLQTPKGMILCNMGKG